MSQKGIREIIYQIFCSKVDSNVKIVNNFSFLFLKIYTHTHTHTHTQVLDMLSVKLDLSVSIMCTKNSKIFLYSVVKDYR